MPVSHWRSLVRQCFACVYEFDFVTQGSAVVFICMCPLCEIIITIIIITTTAIGLSPGGSSPTLVQTKIKIHKTTEQRQNIKKQKTK
jgi:hypothetical protein